MVPGLRKGDCCEVVLVEDLKRTQIVQYAGASGDFNPLHTDERYATEVAKSPSVFAHGMLTAGMTGLALANLSNVGYVTHFGGRFLERVWPGDSLYASFTVTDVKAEPGKECIDLDVTTRNQHGVPVFSGRGTVSIVT